MPNRTPDLEVLCLREFRFEPPARRARNGGASAGHQCLTAAPAGRGGRGGGRTRERKQEGRCDGGPRRRRPARWRAPPSSLCPPSLPSFSLTPVPLLPRPFSAPVSAPVSLLPHPYPPAPSALLPHPGALPSSSLGPVTLLPHPCPDSGVSKIGSSDRQAAERQVRDWPGLKAVWP